MCDFKLPVGRKSPSVPYPIHPQVGERKFWTFSCRMALKLLYLMAKICTQGSNRGGALPPPHENLWGGIRPPCPPASYAYV